MRFLAALIIAAMLPAPGPAVAQQRPAEPEPAAETSRPAEQVPISVERVRRELARPIPPRAGALRLDYYIEVYGKASALAFLEGVDFTGPAPYGAPTHREILNMITPKEFRAPAADIGALIAWINQKVKERQKAREQQARPPSSD